MDNKYIVISLGGSLIVPEEIDTSFLKLFISAIKSYTDKGLKFVLITGGGKICRKYNQACEELVDVSVTDLDWLGIAATRLNAELLRISFGELAHATIIMDPDQIPETEASVLVGGGWKPGNSSDLAAIHAAKSVGAKKVINLSNIDYAYDKDPKKFPDAVKIEQSSWEDFMKILPMEWSAGLNAPFDPIAAREAQALGLEVAIMNGKNIENLKHYLDGDAFIGTVIN